MSVYQQWQALGLPILPERKLYVLAEASKQNTLLARMEFHAVAARSLWRVEYQPELEPYAPYLIEIPENSAFDHWLSANSDTVPIVILSAQMTFDEVWAHLRHFTKFETQGQKYYLRIGAAAMFHTYVASVAKQHETVTKLFSQGRIDGMLFQDTVNDLSQFCRPSFEKRIDKSLR